MKKSLVNNEIIYKTVFTFFGTLMTIVLTYAGVKVASIANAIAKEQVNIQSLEVEIALNEKLPLFEIQTDGPEILKNDIRYYVEGIGPTGDIIFDLKSLFNDVDKEFTEKYEVSYVDCYDNLDVRKFLFYINGMPSKYYMGLILSIEPSISSAIKFIIENKTDNTQILDKLSKDMNRIIWTDHGKVKIINRGGKITNAVVYPSYILCIYHNRSEHYINLCGLSLSNDAYFIDGDEDFISVSIDTPNPYYMDFLIRIIETELSEEYDISIDSGLYINIMYQDFFKEQHDEMYMIDGEELQEITDKQQVDNLIYAEPFDVYYYNEDMKRLKDELKNHI